MIKNNINSKSRILIFSEFSFRKISYGFEKNDINYSLLQGPVGSQNKILEDYKDGKIQILLLNAKHFGAGLDLQITTNIILFHKFTDISLKTQVIGRAQRIGRTEPLTVTYLQYEDE